MSKHKGGMKDSNSNLSTNNHQSHNTSSGNVSGRKVSGLDTSDSHIPKPTFLQSENSKTHSGESCKNCSLPFLPGIIIFILSFLCKSN
jgi:hypothetical protein